jgi:hypothetical protein
MEIGSDLAYAARPFSRRADGCPVGGWLRATK